MNNEEIAATPKFTGDVVHLIDGMKVVINGGRSDGIKVGMKVLIFGVGPMIRDIDGSDLGTLELVRGNGIVKYVQDKISTVVSEEKRRNSTRTVKRTSDVLGGLGLGRIYAPREEVIEGPEFTAMPFNDPEVGDKYKIIG